MGKPKVYDLADGIERVPEGWSPEEGKLYSATLKVLGNLDRYDWRDHLGSAASLRTGLLRNHLITKGPEAFRDVYTLATGKSYPRAVKHWKTPGEKEINSILAATLVKDRYYL